MAEALYRKYRPQVFEDMVGQQHIERTLKNAIDQDKVSHAYLFCGPRGTGKTTTARLLAKALLCEDGPTSTPDGTCRECTEVAEGTHPDVYELDAASRTGVENVREEIIGRVNFAPVRGKKKIYIIDEVHMLSTAAFNALLKTLEEPPSHVVFILCTTDPQKVPATIHSRCQRFDFHRLGTDEIVSRLGAICMAEGVEFEGDALALIAHRADGGMRNALTSLEQLIAFGDGSVTMQGAEDLLGSLDASDMAEIVRAVGRRDVAACFNWTADYVETGADLAQFARDMAQRVRNLYVMSLAGTDVALDVPDAERGELSDELRLFGPDRLARMMGVLGDLISELRTASNPRLCFEIALTRMVRPDSDLTLESLAERIEALEAGKSAVATYVPEPALPTVAAGSGAVTVPAPVQSVAPASNASARAFAPTAFSQTAQSGANAPFVPARQAFETSDATRMPSVRPEVESVPQPTAQPSRQEPSASVAPAAEPVDVGSGVSPSSPASNLAAIVLNPAALQRMWRSVVTAVKKDRISYGVLFVNVKARAEEDGGGVIVEFPADNPFAFNMAAKPEVQQVMAAAFQQVAGMPVPFRCVQAKATPTQAAPSAPVPLAPSAAGASQQQASPASARQMPAQPAPTPERPAPMPVSVPVQQEPAASPSAPAQRETQVQPEQAPERQVPAQPAPRQPVPSTQQEETAGAAPAPVRSDDAPAYADDEVPLDVYESNYGYEEDGAFSASFEPRDEYAQRPRAASAPVMSAAELIEAVRPVESAQPAQAQAVNPDDYSKMISGSMGIDIVFEEVDD